jgi:hypothetical protein
VQFDGFVAKKADLTENVCEGRVGEQPRFSGLELEVADFLQRQGGDVIGPLNSNPKRLNM